MKIRFRSILRAMLDGVLGAGVLWLLSTTVPSRLPSMPDFPGARTSTFPRDLNLFLDSLTHRGVRVCHTKSSVETARCDVTVLKNALLHFRKLNDRLPERLEDLARPDRKNFDEPYIDCDPQVTTDPWGSPYVLQVDGSRFTVISYGGDGVPGGEREGADIVAEHP